MFTTFLGFVSFALKCSQLHPETAWKVGSVDATLSANKLTDRTWLHKSKETKLISFTYIEWHRKMVENGVENRQSTSIRKWDTKSRRTAWLNNHAAIWPKVNGSRGNRLPVDTSVAVNDINHFGISITQMLCKYGWKVWRISWVQACNSMISIILNAKSTKCDSYRFSFAVLFDLEIIFRPITPEMVPLVSNKLLRMVFLWFIMNIDESQSDKYLSN